MAASLWEALEMVERARALPGVKEAVFSVPHANRCATDRLTRWVEEQRDRWEAAGRG